MERLSLWSILYSVEVNFIALLLVFCTKIHSHHSFFFPTEFPPLNCIMWATICCLVLLICFYQYFLSFKFCINSFWASPLTPLLSEYNFSMQHALNKCLLMDGYHWLTPTCCTSIDVLFERNKIVVELIVKLNYCLGNLNIHLKCLMIQGM